MLAFQPDMAVRVNAGLALRQVGLTQSLHLCDNTFVLVCARTHTTCLEERMDLTVQELTVLVDADLNHGCIAGDTRQTDVIGSAEVSQTIGDEATFIHLDTTYHMGTVTIDDIGAVVDTEMGQLA